MTQSSRVASEDFCLKSLSQECLALSKAAFELVKDRIPQTDIETVRGFIYDHNEWGLGMETIVDAFLAENIAVTTEQKDAILAAMDAMSLDRCQRKLRVAD